MERILIVDDDGIVRLLVRRTFEKRGYQCSVAGSVDEARAALAAGEFHLLLCDVDMPGESGISLVREVLQASSPVSVIMVTGVDDPDAAAVALDLGVYGYVIKPFKTNELIIHVANALRRRALEVENREYLYKLQFAMAVASEVQKSLFPRKPPNIQGICVAGKSIPCDETGGDYYDFIELSEHRLAIAIGDVSGHGIGSALLMSGVRAFLRAIAADNLLPSDALHRLNHHLLISGEDGNRFVTLFYAIVDRERQTLVFASAGHDFPVLIRAGGGEVIELESTGYPLGLEDAAIFENSEEIALAPGDRVVFMTDGVWEADNVNDERYGRDRLLLSIRNCHSLPPEPLIAALLDDLRAFIVDQPPTDDLTLVVAAIE